MEKFKSEQAESNRRHLGNLNPITAERHSQLDDVRKTQLQTKLKFSLMYPFSRSRVSVLSYLGLLRVIIW